MPARCGSASRRLARLSTTARRAAPQARAPPALSSGRAAPRPAAERVGARRAALQAARRARAGPAVHGCAGRAGPPGTEGQLCVSARMCVAGRAPGLCTASLGSHTPGSRWHRAVRVGARCSARRSLRAPFVLALRSQGLLNRQEGRKRGRARPPSLQAHWLMLGLARCAGRLRAGTRRRGRQAAGCLWAAPGTAGGRVPVGLVIGACPPSRTAQPARSGTAGWFGRARDTP